MLLFCSSAIASKEVVAFIPSDKGDIAVNSSGAGPADAGDIYVLGDSGLNRVTRFATDDNGTPANPYDDTYPFVATWGADVDSTPSGGTDYEICTVQAECKAGAASGGNGTATGNGVLSSPRGIAVDQDTGNVYVSDRLNNRVNVYTGDGTFLRSFGFDVVESGPGNTGTGYEICVAASGDVCKAGVAGAGVGQLDVGLVGGVAVSPADGNPTAGTVFLADGDNHRVNTYALDGSAPASFGSAAVFGGGAAPQHVAVDSRGIVYASDRNKNSEVDRYDSQNANGGGIGFLAPIASPPLSVANEQRKGLEVDPDSDGLGPDKDILYVIRDGGDPHDSVVQQFGPVNEPGLTAPPATQDDQHGLLVGFVRFEGIATDTTNGRIFVTTGNQSPQFGIGPGTYVLDTAGGAPTASIDSISGITATTATVNGTVNPNGPPPVSYRLEYSLNGTDWTVDPGTETVLGTQSTPQSVSPVLDPPGTGLLSGTEYHVRLAAIKVFNPAVVSAVETFTTLPAPPQVETTGAPVRTATTAQLTGRVNPRGAATEYHFEYGAEGPCDANPCTSTTPQPAGSGQLIQLLAEDIAGLSPGTTYHYRLVADNGNPGSPAFGEDITVTTRASDAPLTHGDFPGPPGSDRAWELVSAPDTSGNPVLNAWAFSDNGERAAYRIAGGIPGSNTGSAFGLLASERPLGDHPSSGWRFVSLEPPRDQLVGQQWTLQGNFHSADDLSSLFVWNSGVGKNRFFRLSPEGSTMSLMDMENPSESSSAASADGSTVFLSLGQSFSPAHLPGSGSQVYDLSSGAPELVSYLPDGSVGPCEAFAREVSADGSLLIFSCGQLYVRDLGGGTTTAIGPGSLLKSTPDDVFFVTGASLHPDDGGGADVYRYDLTGGATSCVTCVVEGVDAAVTESSVAVSDDGSRLYFKSPNRLLPGAPPDSIYRVEVASGELAYVADIGDAKIGESPVFSQAISADGNWIAFRSSAAALNPLGGQNNAATLQYYLYNDSDRSLICVSCPADNTPPLAEVPKRNGGGGSGDASFKLPNITPLADDGTFAFVTASPLLPSDQNTPGQEADPWPGTDVYEWRDGRILLVTDGISSWPAVTPVVQGISPSGRDVFFAATAQYTADALDDQLRLYDARIGGGIDFPELPRPCPLEVCQGTPKGAPEDLFPSSAAFAGSGNLTEPPPIRRCRKGQRRVRRGGKVRCVKRPQRKNRSNRNRRSAR